MDMTEAIKEAYAYADPDVTLFETFEFTHTFWTESIRIVDSSISLPTAQGDFSPVSLTVQMPETESSVRGQLKVTISFLPVEYRELMYTVSQENDPVYMYYRQYMKGNVDPQLELPVPLTVSSFEFGEDKTVIQALYPDLVNIVFCRKVMTASVIPGGRV